MRRKYKFKIAVVVLLALLVYGIIYGTAVHHDGLLPGDKRTEFNKGTLKRTTGSEQGHTNLHTSTDPDRRPQLTVPKMAKYCNTPHSRDLINEGLVPEHYKLLSVYVVIVPGSSAPTSRLLNGANHSCLVDASQYDQHSKVASYVRVMAAASQRTPRDFRFNRWALYPSHVTCSSGQLTGFGAVQSIITGLHYSERYYHFHKLFNETNWQSKVSAETIQTSRTFQSAVAFLYGLIPGFDYAKINLIASKRLDFCENGSLCACLNIDSFRNKAVRECRLDQTYLSLLKKYNDVVQRVKTVLNVPESKHLDPADLLDILTSYTCHNMPRPCNSQGLCLTDTTLEPLLALVENQRRCMTRNQNYKRFAKATMHGLLNRIAQEMSLMMAGKSNRAFQLYSGHPTIFLQLITALGLRDTAWSGYAASITFELFRNCKTEEHVVRVSQSGRAVTTQLGLNANGTGDGFCNFNRFQDQISGYFHYHQDCDHAKYFLSL